MVKRYGRTAPQCESPASAHEPAERYCEPCKVWFWNDVRPNMHVQSSGKHKEHLPRPPSALSTSNSSSATKPFDTTQRKASLTPTADGTPAPTLAPNNPVPPEAAAAPIAPSVPAKDELIEPTDEERFVCTHLMCRALSFTTAHDADAHTTALGERHRIRKTNLHCPLTPRCDRWFSTRALVELHTRWGPCTPPVQAPKGLFVDDAPLVTPAVVDDSNGPDEGSAGQERVHGRMMDPKVYLQNDEQESCSLEGDVNAGGYEGSEANSMAISTPTPTSGTAPHTAELGEGQATTVLSTLYVATSTVGPKALGCAAPQCHAEVFESRDAANFHFAQYLPDRRHKLRVAKKFWEPRGRWFRKEMGHTEHLVTAIEHASPEDLVNELAKKDPLEIKRAVETLTLQHIEEGREGGGCEAIGFEPSPLKILKEIKRSQDRRDVPCLVPTCKEKFKTAHSHATHLESSTHSDIPRDQIAEMVKTAWGLKQATAPSIGPSSEEAVENAPAVPCVDREWGELAELPSALLAVVKKGKKARRNIPCPVPNCPKTKKFKTPNALASHLNSWIHSDVPRDLIARMIQVAQFQEKPTAAQQASVALANDPRMGFNAGPSAMSTPPAGVLPAAAADAPPQAGVRGSVEPGPPLGPREIEAGLAASSPPDPEVFPFRARHVAGPFKGNIRF